MTKLGPEDDIEAFLEMFERMAEAAQWAPAQWAYLISPYLTCPAQAAVKVLSKDDAADYKKVKAAILDRYEIAPEKAQQKFQSLAWTPTVHPRAMAVTLQDAALRWLQPKTDGRLVVDSVVLEQLLIIMPPRACL